MSTLRRCCTTCASGPPAPARGWPCLGIANTLDLPDRLLPRIACASTSLPLLFALLLLLLLRFACALTAFLESDASAGAPAIPCDIGRDFACPSEH